MAAALTVAVGAISLAFLQMFTSFQAYDDEGYLLVSLRSFLDGGNLYDDVYTQYGPAYYLVFGAMFKLAGVEPSTDAGRFITMSIWLLVPVLLGIATWLGTRRAPVAVVGGLAAYATMVLLVPEPMHPVGLSTLVFAAASIALVAIPRRPGVAWPVLGVLLAFLALTKVNLGAFAVLALAVALALATQTDTSRRPVRFAIAALVLAPFVLLLPDLADRGPYNLLVLLWAGTAGVVAVGVGVEVRAGDRRLVRDALALGGGAFAGAAFVLLAVTLLLGSSLSAVIDGLLVEPSKLREVFVIAFTTPDATVWWAVAAVVGALAVRRRPDRRLPSGPAGAAIRGVAAIAILAAVAQASPLTFGPPSGPLPVGALLLWLLLVPPTGVERDRETVFVRTGLVLLALIEMLQVYPVAGTQVRAASVLMIVPAGMLLGDALDELAAWSARTQDQRGPGLLANASNGVLAVAVALALASIAQPLTTFVHTWGDFKPLVTSGSSTLRLPPGRADGFADLARTVRRECRALVTYPGFNSLYVWSGIAPPTGLNAGTWMLLLDAEQQQRVVDAVADEPGTCLVRNPKQAEGWLQGRPLPDRPLARFVTTQFENPRPFLDGEYELLTRIGTGGPR